MQKIIGVCGLIGSGKGTVADTLVEEHGFVKISFAGKLKDVLATMFGWDRELIEGETKESRVWREQPDAYWSNEIGKDVSPRLVMQLFGTECMRKGFYDGIWTSIVKQEMLKNPNTNYVIPDTRFSNEIEMINSLGGEIWQVRRGDLPTWWENAIHTNKATRETEWLIYDSGEHMEVSFPEIHASEWAWVNTDDHFKHIIKNEKTLDDLKFEVNNIVNDLIQ